MKRKPRHLSTMDDILTVLAAVERSEPGKLASWNRAQPPEIPIMQRAFFVSYVDLQQPQFGYMKLFFIDKSGRARR